MMVDSTTAVGRPGDPCIMVICGASGDLTKRKLIPALYNLATDNLLSKSFALVGMARSQMTSEEFRDKISEEIGQFATGAVDQDMWHWLARRIYYVSGAFDDPQSFARLKEQLDRLNIEHGTRDNYFFYLATSPNFFATIVRHLGEAGLVN